MRNSDMLVRDIMTFPVTTLKPDDKLVTAADVMQLGRIRHLPVVDADGRVVGVVTQRDLFHSALLKALGYGEKGAQKLQSMFTVKDAMRAGVITTTPDTVARAAARTMLEHKIGCLPIVEDGKLVGILTEADFVALVAEP